MTPRAETPPSAATLVPAACVVPFVLLTACFAAWGLANNMTDPLVKVFSRIFTMSALQSSLVQFSFYGAYFCLALPAAIIIKRYSYKTGVLVGLGLFAAGSLLFLPASRTMQFGHFLLAIFVLAGGLSILETSCNPYIIALGPPDTATRRLNLAQSFNPVGSVVGTMLAGFMILPYINPASDVARAAMPPEQLRAVQAAELSAVMLPYVAVAAALVVLWTAIAVAEMPPSSDAGPRIDLLPTVGRLARNRHYAFGVVAQFFYVAAQICVWTFTIHYISAIVERGDGGPLLKLLESSGIHELVRSIRLIRPRQPLSGETVAGMYHICALVAFLAFRFICTALMRVLRPSLMLAALGAAAMLLTLVVMLSPDLTGVICLVAISACMSLMFPTIYGIALHGLGDDTKLGGAGLVMAILGGALFPLVQGALVDARGPAFSYVVPLVCFLVVTSYGLFDLRSKRIAHAS
ncbi:MAG TPA: L-fucose:H+ symporter permease [Vicinamibacterales bacterium]|nr:L-fucose:H+ symporter permease [Vicinamibacterales bacterium]